MKTTKIIVLLAFLVGAGMLLTGMATAAGSPGSPGPNDFFLEIEASGKGYQTDTNDNTTPATTVYETNKHKLDTKILYGWYYRETQTLYVAYYSESAGIWPLIGFSVTETEEGLLNVNINGLSMYQDADGDTISSTGNLRIQFKEKDGTVNSAKIKSLAMSYYRNKSDPPANTRLFGSLKMKGKIAAADELPAEIQTLFGIAP